MLSVKKLAFKILWDHGLFLLTACCLLFTLFSEVSWIDSTLRT